MPTFTPPSTGCDLIHSYLSHHWQSDLSHSYLSHYWQSDLIHSHLEMADSKNVAAAMNGLYTSLPDAYDRRFPLVRDNATLSGPRGGWQGSPASGVYYPLACVGGERRCGYIRHHRHRNRHCHHHFHRATPLHRVEFAVLQQHTIQRRQDLRWYLAVSLDRKVLQRDF